MKNRFLAVTLAAGLAATVAAAALPPIASTWKDKPIVVDGLISKEWPVLTPLGDGIAVAASNDAANLYLAIVTSDIDRLRQIGTNGVFVWLDAGGGTKQTFGIHVPGIGTSGALQRFGRFPGGPGSTDTRGDRGGDPGASGGTDADVPSRERPQPKVTYVELLGSGKGDTRRVELAAEDAVEAAAAMNDGTLLVELKVPIEKGPKDFPYGIGGRLDRPIGLGIEAPKGDAESGASNIGRGGFGGMGRGGRGGRGGYGGGNAGAMRPGRAPAKELKLWTTISFAAPDTRSRP
jgi:hypothetical protein